MPVQAHFAQELALGFAPMQNAPAPARLHLVDCFVNLIDLYM